MECVSNARLAVSRTESRTTAHLLNLGCGQRFHPAWTNLDLRPADPSICPWDVTHTLPFSDASFDVVYHSHLLEHLPREQALPFLRECQRVLKAGGLLRLAIPNLEAIARLYLNALEDAWYGDKESLANHRWLVMELYDQTTREEPGGGMLSYLSPEGDGTHCELAWYRLGIDGVIIRKHLAAKAQGQPSLGLVAMWRERLLRWLLGDEYRLLQLGRFRRAGEVHHWMYDRVSLRALLQEAGFIRFRCVGPMESAIPTWTNYHLDTTPEGDVCKPDSLFVEADKP